MGETISRLNWNSYNNLRNITIPDSVYVKDSKNSLVFANMANLEHCILGNGLVNLYFQI